jgi:hypothetical protein
MIYDPPPPPSTNQLPQATVSPSAQLHFGIKSLQMTTVETVPGAGIRGTVTSQAGAPMRGIVVRAQHNEAGAETKTGPDGDFFILLLSPGPYTLIVGDDSSSALPLILNRHDIAVVEWQALDAEPESSLPLAEIRTVDLVWDGALAFKAESPWDQARYRWSVSGGELENAGDRVVWTPPSRPGRYLLQVIADWGRTGLAVDSIVLAVDDEGTVSADQ